MELGMAKRTNSLPPEIDEIKHSVTFWFS